MRKRMLSLILIISLLAGLSSCGDSSTEDTTGTPTTTSAPEETKRDDLPDDLDFAGAEIKFLCRDSDANSGYRNELDFTEEDGDLVNDAIYKRNIDVQERLNVKFTMQTVNGSWGNRNEYLGLVRDSVLAGDDAYDIVVGYEAYIPTLAVEHLVKNLHDIPYIDFDKPWWNKRLLESNTIGDKCYFVSGDIGLSYTSSIWVIYFNKVMAENLGITDIYQDVLDGRWTKDLYTEYAKLATSDLNGDSQMTIDNDQFGNVGNGLNPYFSGIQLTDFDDKHIPSLNFDDQRIYDMVEWLDSFYNKSGYSAPWNELNTSHEVALKIFNDGRALFYYNSIGRMENMRSTSFDFGLVPFYKWDESQEEYYTTMHDGVSMFCVPITSQNDEAVGATMEALAVEGYYSVLPAYYDVTLQGKYTRDENSNKMLEIIRSSVICTFDMVYNYQLGGVSTFWGTLVSKGTSDFASYYASNKDKWDNAMTSLVNTLLDE